MDEKMITKHKLQQMLIDKSRGIQIPINQYDEKEKLNGENENN